jgi:hypothetical protein
VIERLRPTRSARSLNAGRGSRGRDSDSGTFDPVVARAGRDRVSAGQTLVGEVVGPLGPVSVDVVRIEQTPSGQRLHSCQQATAVSAWSATDPNPARATFELEVPDDAVPDWDENVLWTASVPIELPAATEALTVASRYEVVVSRRIRHWPDQHATLTPLLIEAA